MQQHRREVLREASVALQGRVVTLWEVSSRAEVLPVMTSAGSAQPADPRLDLDSTLHRWGAPIIQGSRWVGCWLDDAGAGLWCIAPVRKQPAAPPPDGVERRSRERMTLELAGLCLGLVDQPAAVTRPRLPEPDALAELARQFLRSIQDRARGGLARSERFDAAQVVRSCVALERPLAGKRSVALEGVVSVSDVF